MALERIFFFSFGGWPVYPLLSYSSETKELMHFIGPLIIHCDLRKKVCTGRLNVSSVPTSADNGFHFWNLHHTAMSQSDCHFTWNRVATHISRYYLADQVQAKECSVHDEVMHVSLGMLQPLKLNTLWQRSLFDACCYVRNCYSQKLWDWSLMLLQLFGTSGPVRDIWQGCVCDLLHS